MLVNQLRIKLWEYIQKLDNVNDYFDLNNMSNDEELANLLAVEEEQLKKDIKFANDSEIIIANKSMQGGSYVEQPLFGFHILKDGFTLWSNEWNPLVLAYVFYFLL